MLTIMFTAFATPFRGEPYQSLEVPSCSSAAISQQKPVWSTKALLSSVKSYEVGQPHVSFSTIIHACLICSAKPLQLLDLWGHCRHILPHAFCNEDQPTQGRIDKNLSK